MIKIAISVLIFVGGYIVGAREPAADAIRLGDLARNLLYCLVIGVGPTIIGFLLYYFYFSPTKEKLAKKDAELENAQDHISTLKREYNREIEEHKRKLNGNVEKYVAERVNDELKLKIPHLRREIYEQVERMYRDEADRINGVSRSKENRSIKKKPISGKVETCRVSNGKLYAKLKEGDPLNHNR